jgi:hypothetical protein
MTVDLTPDRISQLAFGFWGPKVLLGAVGLGVFTERAKGSQDAATLSAKLGLHPRSALDFLDALVALACLTARTARCQHARDGDVPGPGQAVLRRRHLGNGQHAPVWLLGKADGLRTGQPQHEAKAGQSPFEVLYGDPARLRLFLQGMTGLSLGAAKAIAPQFPWKSYRTFIDRSTAPGAARGSTARAGSTAPARSTPAAAGSRHGVYNNR